MKVFNMPVGVNNSNEYLAKFDELLINYLSFCQGNLAELEIDYDIAFKISTSIKNVLSFYFLGNVKKAYENIYKLFEENMEHLFTIDFDDFYESGINKPFNAYRTRYSDKILSRNTDLFHIPFNR